MAPSKCGRRRPESIRRASPQFDAGIGVSLAAVPNAEQQALDFAWDRRRAPEQDRQRAVAEALEEACQSARPFKHRRRADLDLGHQNISDGVGDLNAEALAGLLRLFKLNTDCAKAVHNVRRVVAIEDSGTRPLASRRPTTPAGGVAFLAARLDSQLKGGAPQPADADGILAPAMERDRVIEVTPDHCFQLRE